MDTLSLKEGADVLQGSGSFHRKKQKQVTGEALLESFGSTAKKQRK